MRAQRRGRRRRRAAARVQRPPRTSAGRSSCAASSTPPPAKYVGKRRPLSFHDCTMTSHPRWLSSCKTCGATSVRELLQSCACTASLGHFNRSRRHPCLVMQRTWPSTARQTARADADACRSIGNECARETKARHVARRLIPQEPGVCSSVSRLHNQYFTRGTPAGEPPPRAVRGKRSVEP